MQIVFWLILQKLRSRLYLTVTYFSATSNGLKIITIFGRILKLDVREADYSFVDIVDTDGGLDLERSRLLDPIPICESVRSTLWERSLLVKWISRRLNNQRVLLYLDKAAEESISVVAIKIGVVAWFGRTHGSLDDKNILFFIKHTPWHRQIKFYAASRGVKLNGYSDITLLNLFSILKRWKLLLLLGKVALHQIKNLFTQDESAHSRGYTVESAANPSFTVAIPYFGNGLTVDLSKNSDLFWSPYADLDPNQLLIYSTRSDDPIDDERYRSLRESRIHAVALRKGAVGGVSIPSWPSIGDVKVLLPFVKKEGFRILLCGLFSLISIGSTRWIAARLTRLLITYLYWKWFFVSYKVKVHVDYGDWAKNRIASDLAISDLGGTSISYQRSYEAFPSIQRASSVDVHFSFGTHWVDTERESKSVIQYYVANGYIHDHAFSIIRERCEAGGGQLFKSSVGFTICLLDENSFDDKREGQSHDFISQDYRFLLERLIEDPELGLIIKPKKPVSLRRRLGDVAALLDLAVETGRCYLHTEGIVATDMLPCEASAISDITIALLYGSTAAFEAALFGSRTVLIDREKQINHPLYSLGEGKVVFKQWNNLWNALDRYKINPSEPTDFGEWRPILDNLDEFQDGKAAERMGQYIGWICESYKDGLSREEGLRGAAARYASIWGEDKISDLSIVDK